MSKYNVKKKGTSSAFRYPGINGHKNAVDYYYVIYKNKHARSLYFFSAKADKKFQCN